MNLRAGLDRVLFVHAHPDDETISTGALIAELAARGTRVALLTATRGERGEVVAGPLSALEGTDALSIRRELELRQASEALGISESYWLGEPPARVSGLPPRRYQDSGMTWIREGLAGPADDAGPAALTTAPLADVTADVAALIDSLRPDLVISYDDGGGYGHPDHVRMHDAASAASRALGVPFAEIVEQRTLDVEWFELAHRRASVLAALGCHATQLTVDGTDIVHSGGQRQPIPVAVGLRIR
ncbi:PIG-L family deacetylase [Glaciibacter psychrotolerans]|uniref:N-acetyl-1-D-myo-inositol-2-amino-2-deoxy-alpha-D-glucopyranoside deacetylase n=1 Tax=Glaciibacter psychrotolerans TaxID=670054 RepID=A0A7Z0J6P0_9MICO|nr:PIG-L family deacetylase [Leifsonia psychrotolerans]NYJ20134.1 N-acetyl-1-D-myo-inositol-2-amino-2-deoxy-alpha-D-glucopyranoside deacetylase [Leifsonia psychrotolerans]